MLRENIDEAGAINLYDSRALWDEIFHTLDPLLPTEDAARIATEAERAFLARGIGWEVKG